MQEEGIQVCAGNCPVELTRARVDVRSGVGLYLRLGLKYGGDCVASAKDNSLEHAQHGVDAVFANTCVLTDTVHGKYTRISPPPL